MNPYKINRWKRKPYMMYLFLAIQSIIFAYMQFIAPLTTGYPSESWGLVVMLGGMYPQAIIEQGEWWRFITPIFIHIGWTHFVLNSVTLYFIGEQLEELYGHLRFALLYLGAGILGNFVSFAFNGGVVAAGASTSLFGLFAALAILRFFFPENYGVRQLASQFLLLIALNLVMNVFDSSVDMHGHLGGAIGGALLAILCGMPRNMHRYKLWMRTLAAIGVLALVLLCLYVGFTYYKYY
ncbi:rhomboid protease GluP [Pilibacter termitis]|uniref:Rhomboid protease GluP n=1 Tax=Pilibacter termitis TaxID=263852 RepID=A0A1T4NTD9_9ENTE|nr:rhomboid family intramembrane serine protease [Pilibacter termitis]SJZ81978.1 rhomboid protease GluP [Pilibacter termitis]